MNDFGSVRSKQWMYTSSNPAPSETGGIDQEATWGGFGSSMNAISFGFVATAVLVSMFVLMAIFEHLFRPNPSLSSPQQHSVLPQSRPLDMLGNPQHGVPKIYSSDFSVVMPGQHCPTHIAKPAPMPCPREGICWPPHHEHNINLAVP